jgi:hypothetical protein
MRDHYSPSSVLRHVTSLNTFSNTSDLVDLQKKSVDELLVDSSFNSLWVSN